MTREEAIKILRKLLAEDEDIDFFSYDEKVAVEYFISLSENKGEWIPVSERLPELDGEYLITYLTQGVYSKEDILVVCISDYDHDNGFWKSRKGKKVIAWQPLPKPYEAEKGGE